jgi:hypothetical protein
MPSVDVHSTAYLGRTSRPAAPIAAIEPGCTRCGSSLVGRLERVQREQSFTLWIWKCSCGRRRRLRREGVSAV